MEVNMIVAVGKDGAIGRNGDLIWHIREDLRRFKALTLGHPVIMGRKTWESLPKRPLPGRVNIVITRNPDYKAEGAEVVTSPDAALAKAGEDSPFIMGGEQIYRLFMPLATTLFLTEVDAACPDADAFIQYPLDPSEWQASEMSDIQQTPEGIPYRYATYLRK